ncbi:MAG TPA: hypothetical protein VFX96_07120, partial [Pyrinomonadaceae bacterium]|nr:hypothetical protein [Pyrinomonadaceae bacterium]
SSFVLLTAGLALQLLGVCFWLVDIKGYRRWAVPFLVFGTNALALYFLAELTARVIPLITFAREGGGRVNLHTVLYQNLFASWASPANASLMFAICVVLFWLGVMSLFYRKRNFIKV